MCLFLFTSLFIFFLFSFLISSFVFLCSFSSFPLIKCKRWGSNPRLRREQYLKLPPWTTRPLLLLSFCSLPPFPFLSPFFSLLSFLSFSFRLFSVSLLVLIFSFCFSFSFFPPFFCFFFSSLLFFTYYFFFSIISLLVLLTPPFFSFFPLYINSPVKSTPNF